MCIRDSVGSEMCIRDSPNARDLVATVSQPTFTLGRIQATGMGTHVGVRLTCDSAGYARLANIIAHIDFNESD
jgi:hypothetical protein